MARLAATHVANTQRQIRMSIRPLRRAPVVRNAHRAATYLFAACSKRQPAVPALRGCAATPRQDLPMSHPEERPSLHGSRRTHERLVFLFAESRPHPFSKSWLALTVAGASSGLRRRGRKACPSLHGARPTLRLACPSRPTMRPSALPGRRLATAVAGLRKASELFKHS